MGITLSYRPEKSNWRADLLDGKQAELRVAEYFRRLGYHVEQSDGYAPGHDLTITGKIEIKHDRTAVRTGNVAIEFHCRGQLSGFASTESAWWVFVVGDTAYAISTVKLRGLVSGLPVRSMGDGLESRGYLLPVVTLARHARLIHLTDLSEAEL